CRESESAPDTFAPCQTSLRICVATPAQVAARTPTPLLSSEGRGRPHPTLRVFLKANGGCIRERDQSWRASVFHRACCFPFSFCRTLPGNPLLQASLPASPYKNRRETPARIVNDKTEHHARAHFGRSSRRKR